MATYTVTTGNDVTQYTVSTGARGPAGPSGVGTTEEVLGLLQGTAGDSTRIGAEYMPEETTFESVTFADGSELTQDDGVFTGGADDLLYRHNGIDQGGIAYRPEPENIIRILLNASSSILQRQPQLLAVNGSVVSVSTTGYVVSTFTASSANGGAPIVNNVPVSAGDTGTVVASKIAAVLNADPLFNAYYEASNFGPFVYCQCLTTTVDATLTHSIAVGDTTGITATSLVSKTSCLLDLGYFDIPASLAQPDSKFIIDGSMFAVKPGTGNVYIRLIAEENWTNSATLTLTTQGTVFTVPNDTSGTAKTKLEFNYPMTIKTVSGSDLKLSWENAHIPTVVPALKIVANYGTGVIEQMNSMAFTATANSYNVFTQSMPVRIRIVAFIPYNAAAGSVYLSGKMQLKKVSDWP